MKKITHVALVIAFTLGFWLIQFKPVGAQTTGLTLLNRNNQSISSLIDGNQVRLKVDLDSSVSAETQVDFFLVGIESSVATCKIASGQRGCATDSFPALGWYWNPDGSAQPQREIRAQANGQQVEGSLSVAVSPRPVVMVHGYNSDWTGWTSYLGTTGFLQSIGLHGYSVGDRQAPGAMNTGSIADPNARTNTIAQNAVILGKYIDGVRKSTGADKVDLLVHSMGGLISRYYLDRVMTDEAVSQIIILATPMGGTSCANLPAALGFLLPASLELQPAYINGIFNQQIVHRHGVPFHAVAGTKLADALESPCTPAPSDVAVSIESVKVFPMPVQEIPLLHSQLNASLEVFEKFVKPLLETPPGKFETPADQKGGSVVFTPRQFTKVYTGHINPGETKDVVIHIDPNVTVANFALYDTTRTLSVSVTGASGKTIQLDPVKNGEIKIEDPSTMIYLGYGFKQPKPGKWIVTLLTTSETPAQGADYAISAQFNGGATLTAKANVLLPKLNDRLNVTADLTVAGLSVSLVSAQVKLLEPDGKSQDLEMSLNGNHASLEVRPDQTGLYGVEVNTTAKTSDGFDIDRAAFLTFEVQPSNSKIIVNRILAVLVLVSVVLLIRRAIQKRRKKKVMS